MIEQGYSVQKTVKKGVLAGLLSLLPAAAGLGVAVLSSSNVTSTLVEAAPAFPVAALVGFLVALLNWFKNRGK